MYNPHASIEDNINDLRALVKMTLHYAENSEADEFNKLQSEVVTMLYLMMDKVKACEGDYSAIWKQQASGDTDALH